MDQNQELRFIQAFVQRDRRERARFELVSPTKRGAFLNRLCHRFTDVLDMRYVKPVPVTLDTPSSVLAYLQSRHAPTSCYSISARDAIDGTTLPLATAINEMFYFGLPTILVCIPEKLGYFQAEQESGPPPRYFLERP